MKCFQHDGFAADDVDDADVLPIILDNATAIPYRNTEEPLQTNSERIESDDTIVCTAAIRRGGQGGPKNTAMPRCQDYPAQSASKGISMKLQCVYIFLCK